MHLTPWKTFYSRANSFLFSTTEQGRPACRPVGRSSGASGDGGVPGGSCALTGARGLPRGGRRWLNHGSSDPTADEDGLRVGRPWPVGAGRGGEHLGA